MKLDLTLVASRDTASCADTRKPKQDACQPTREMVSDLIAMEGNFINTKHPLFIGGQAALIKVLRRRPPCLILPRSPVRFCRRAYGHGGRWPCREWSLLTCARRATKGGTRIRAQSKACSLTSHR